MQPCVIIANSSEVVHPDVVIKGILEVTDLPEPVCVLPEVRSFPWHITTKYYEADIHLCSLDKKSLGSQAFADSVNGLIISFDSSDKEGINTVEQWYAFTKEFEAEVKILLCDHCISDESETSLSGISKLQAQTWCVENGFELVELNPQEDDQDSDVEDDFQESTGIKRIVQALHAHMWPNLIMKDKSDRLSSLVGLSNAVNGLERSRVHRPLQGNEPKSNGDSISNEHVKEKLVAAVKPLPKESTEKPASNVAVVNPLVVNPLEDAYVISSQEATADVSTSSSNILASPLNTTVPKPSPTRDERIDVMLEAMDSMPEDSFEALFNNLNEMKSKAESLSPSQRKSYAEKMALAFWKSIGGNDSEVEGISSEED